MWTKPLNQHPKTTEPLARPNVNLFNKQAATMWLMYVKSVSSVCLRFVSPQISRLTHSGLRSCSDRQVWNSLQVESAVSSYRSRAVRPGCLNFDLRRLYDNMRVCATICVCVCSFVLYRVFATTSACISFSFLCPRSLPLSNQTAFYAWHNKCQCLLIEWRI